MRFHPSCSPEPYEHAKWRVVLTEDDVRISARLYLNFSRVWWYMGYRGRGFTVESAICDLSNQIRNEYETFGESFIEEVPAKFAWEWDRDDPHARWG